MTTILKTLLIIVAWIHAEQADRTAWDVYTIVDAAYRIAPQYGLDPALMLAVAEVESTWSPRAGCARPGHGCGVYQQVPRWSGMWADECWDGATLTCRQPGGAPLSIPELQDVYRATEVAARHLSYLRARYPHSWIGAYNRGVGRRNDAVGMRYTARVMRVYGRLKND